MTAPRTTTTSTSTRTRTPLHSRIRAAAVVLSRRRRCPPTPPLQIRATAVLLAPLSHCRREIRGDDARRRGRRRRRRVGGDDGDLCRRALRLCRVGGSESRRGKGERRERGKWKRE
ncbi:Os07g0492300 [Oryza sativa Japonica Group]|uniref:Os07g0492300 protein n=2 Tax=Oryza sativa subsp. japonica TaxID=39947 RepID=Q0D6C5_ORYSJ|nr:Os07g0492300 [Oryza sativa Japonica Group]BAT01566.1 Os07g0492300 [Oryza sativa Japonica Group]|eukprot:NP_001059684.1 Os07g0492300 [Oryza sativa Japonica Group]